MLGYSNRDTVAVHLTKACNLKCNHCYQNSSDFNLSVIKTSDIDLMIEKLKPTAILFFGGEPLLCPDIINYVMDAYPDINYCVETNGTIVN